MSPEKTSPLHINPTNDDAWKQASSSLPETIKIAGKQYTTEGLSDKTKKLAIIFLHDKQLIGQFKELIALAELGLNAIQSEVEQSLTDDS